MNSGLPHLLSFLIVCENDETTFLRFSKILLFPYILEHETESDFKLKKEEIRVVETRGHDFGHWRATMIVNLPLNEILLPRISLV